MTLALQCVEAVYKHAVDAEDESAEASAREMIGSFGLTASMMDDCLGGGKYVAMALERNAPLTGNFI